MTLPKPTQAPEIDMDGIMAEQEEWQRRATKVQGSAAQAYERLLTIAERSDTGQARRIAQFVAATFNGKFHFDLFDLRCMDVTLADDMLLCLDALRWAKADLYSLVPNGQSRVSSVIAIWGLKTISIEAN